MALGSCNQNWQPSASNQCRRVCFRHEIEHGAPSRLLQRLIRMLLQMSYHSRNVATTSRLRVLQQPLHRKAAVNLLHLLRLWQRVNPGSALVLGWL